MKIKKIALSKMPKKLKIKAAKFESKPLAPKKRGRKPKNKLFKGV